MAENGQMPEAFTRAAERAPQPPAPSPAPSGETKSEKPRTDKSGADKANDKPAGHESSAPTSGNTTKQSGMSLGKLLLLAAPLVLCVIGVAVYQQSPVAALVLFGAAALALGGVGLKKMLDKRSGKGGSGGGKGSRTSGNVISRMRDRMKGKGGRGSIAERLRQRFGRGGRGGGGRGSGRMGLTSARSGGLGKGIGAGGGKFSGLMSKLRPGGKNSAKNGSKGSPSSGGAGAGTSGKGGFASKLGGMFKRDGKGGGKGSPGGSTTPGKSGKPGAKTSTASKSNGHGGGLSNMFSKMRPGGAKSPGGKGSPRSTSANTSGNGKGAGTGKSAGLGGLFSGLGKNSRKNNPGGSRGPGGSGGGKGGGGKGGGGKGGGGRGGGGRGGDWAAGAGMGALGSRLFQSKKQQDKTSAHGKPGTKTDEKKRWRDKLRDGFDKRAAHDWPKAGEGKFATDGETKSDKGQDQRKRDETTDSTVHDAPFVNVKSGKGGSWRDKKPAGDFTNEQYATTSHGSTGHTQHDDAEPKVVFDAEPVGAAAAQTAHATSRKPRAGLAAGMAGIPAPRSGGAEGATSTDDRNGGTEMTTANLDPTTRDSLRASYIEAASSARRDAQRLQEEVDAARQQADGLKGMEQMEAERNRLLAKAEEAEQEATVRRARGAYLESKADEIKGN